MDEKIIIKSQHYTGKTITNVLRIIGAVLALFFLIGSIGSFIGDCGYYYERMETTYWEHQDRGYCKYFYIEDETCDQCMGYAKYSDSGAYLIASVFDNFDLLLTCVVAGILIFALFVLIAWLIRRYLKSFEMTVTDKRIYGKIKWGRRVDLPLDSVSAVGIGSFKSITVSTSSGRIAFSAIKNRNEIHEIVSKLLVERQNKPAAPAALGAPAPVASTADELKKYKDLLDIGIITQAEFDAKKKQLLGL